MGGWVGGRVLGWDGGLEKSGERLVVLLYVCFHSPPRPALMDNITQLVKRSAFFCSNWSLNYGLIMF